MPTGKVSNNDCAYRLYTVRFISFVAKLSSSCFTKHKLYLSSLSELCAIEFNKLHKDVINWIDTHKESNNNKPAVLIVEGFILFNYK